MKQMRSEADGVDARHTQQPGLQALNDCGIIPINTKKRELI